MYVSLEDQKKESVLVRFYQYSDPHKGYGDSGSLGYKLIPTSELEPISQFNEEGSPDVYFRIDSSTLKKYGFDTYSTGYRIADEESLKNDSNEFERMQSIMNDIEEYIDNKWKTRNVEQTPKF